MSLRSSSYFHAWGTDPTRVARYTAEKSAIIYNTYEDFGNLHNMWKCHNLGINGVYYPSSESVYQAARFPDYPDLQQKIRKIASPINVKGVAHALFEKYGRKDWQDVNVHIMHWCLKLKLMQDWNFITYSLRESGDRVLVELSYKDAFWGARPVRKTGDWIPWKQVKVMEGKNLLGLMWQDIKMAIAESDDEEFMKLEPPEVPNFKFDGEEVGTIEKPKNNIYQVATMFGEEGNIIHGECVKEMKRLPDGEFDLIYADPPYNTGKTKTLRGNSYEDSHADYLGFLRSVFQECRRLLKPDGSIYVQVDQHECHYVKVLMDEMFGRDRFRNDIRWRRSYSKNDANLQQFGRISDTILFYGAKINTDAVKVSLSSAHIKTHYGRKDSIGQWGLFGLTGPGNSNGESGAEWMGYNPGKYGKCWSVPKQGMYAKWLDGKIPGYLREESILKRLDLLNAEGFIHWTKNRRPLLKRYLIPGQSQVPDDIWTDIPPLGPTSGERTEYPTQKPVALVHRIIVASTEQGGHVLDPFAGSGTTGEACMKAGRKFTLIDQNQDAIRIMLGRLKERKTKKGKKK